MKRLVLAGLFLLMWTVSSWAETLIVNDPKDGWLNLRSGPGSSYRVLQRMDNGLRVEEVERRGNWSNIVLPNGVVGWAYRNYMRSAASVAPVAPGGKGGWSTERGEAGRNLMRNGALVARVFLGRDQETGRYYYGLYRVSNDPMIHFMGVSVAHANGTENEIMADGCYGRACMTEYDSDGGAASAQVRIPIAPGNEAWVLEEFQSGKDIEFRYQTEQSYAQNSYKTMRMSLKGSRKAIDALRRQPVGRQATPRPVAQVASPAVSAPAASNPAMPTGGGKTYIVTETKHGDRFCDAPELEGYPPQLNAPQMDWARNRLLNDPYSVKYVNPVSMDFIGRGTTVWRQFPRNNTDIILYGNGAAIARGSVINGSTPSYGPRWKGSWQREDGAGLKIRLKSIKTKSWGHEYYECSHGILTDSLSSGNRPTTDKNGARVMKKAVWRGCSIWIHCERWTDEHPQKTTERSSGYLVEWSDSQVAVEQLRWEGD
ncbi:MAG: SH3 domain-containing protein [Rhodobacteraceae bacterium]|nr:SH3 domain-containing protein [Paracoccaceae bacterium]